MQAQAQCIEGFIPDPADPPQSDESPVPEGAFPVRQSRAPISESIPARAAAVDVIETPPAAPQSFTAELLAPKTSAGWRSEVSRFGIGIGLSALYGVALGSRDGGLSLFKHAVGVPAAMVAVAGLGVPALTIVLTLFNAPLDPPRVLSATSRAAASTGLVLGGFAPAAALFVTTSSSWITAAFIGSLGLLIGGAVGLKRIITDLWGSIESTEDVSTRTAAVAAFVGFTIFALALAARVWTVALPLLRGGAQ